MDKTMKKKILTILTIILCINAVIMLAITSAEPYSEAHSPGDILLFNSLKRTLEKSGKLYFGELRLVGKSVSSLGVTQLFFCVGLKENFVDITKKRRAILPKFVEEKPPAAEDMYGPLALYADCSVFALFRLDSGIWVMQSGTQFVVVEE
jgi:hypothetical protein